MSEQAKCLPGCFGYEGHPTHFHAPGCPNAPKDEMPKCLPGCRPVLGPIPQEWDGVAEMQISHATGCPRDSEPKPPLHAHPTAPKPAQERIYPCDNCGKMRTKDEGGTVFSVCDTCWDKLHPKEPSAEPRILAVPIDGTVEQGTGSLPSAEPGEWVGGSEVMPDPVQGQCRMCGHVDPVLAGNLCQCGHREADHEQFADHDECIMCESCDRFLTPESQNLKTRLLRTMAESERDALRAKLAEREALLVNWAQAARWPVDDKDLSLRWSRLNGQLIAAGDAILAARAQEKSK